MSAPLSNELFYEAHRGFPTGKKHHVRPSLGMHWSTDYKTAEKFSHGSTAYSGGRERGVILHAQIPMSSLETDPVTLKQHDVITDEHIAGGGPEDEIPVRKGATIKVTGLTKRKGKFTRKRTYNPPREMRA